MPRVAALQVKPHLKGHSGTQTSLSVWAESAAAIGSLHRHGVLPAGLDISVGRNEGWTRTPRITNQAAPKQDLSLSPFAQTTS